MTIPYIEVSKDGWTGMLQLSVNDDTGGRRLAGPKFNGSSESLLKHFLTEEDCKALEGYIAQARAVRETA